jgi:hypothetical protein
MRFKAETRDPVWYAGPLLPPADLMEVQSGVTTAVATATIRINQEAS